MQTLTFESGSETDTIELGELLGGVLRPGDLVLLDAPLGAGKTRLVRGVARALGCDESLVASPTYVIVHEYPARSALDPPVVHMDAYRLSGPDDLDSLGFDRIADGTRIVLIEWGERVAAGLASEASLAHVRVQVLDPSRRRIELSAPEAWALRPGWNRLAARADRASEFGKEKTLCPVCGGAVGVSASGGLSGSGGVGGAEMPFCSERCKLADLGRWFSGTYSVSRELVEDDLDDPDLGRTTPGAP